MVSCEDYLTVGSPDQLTSDSFWRNRSDAEAGLSAAYSQLEYSIDTWGFAEVKWPVEAYREDIVVLGYDAMNYPNWVELSNFSYTNGNSQVSEYWWNNYRGISFANQVIEKVATIPDEAIDPAVRSQIVAEAQFLRAYYHLKLILNFERIIVRDKYITNQAELSKALASRIEAWDFIVADLKAATSLPATHSADNVGRATSGAAWAYLGFSWLTRAWEEADKKADYMAEALKAFDSVKGYELDKNFVGMFDGTNKNGRESIFELQFSMSTANGADYRTALHRWIGSQELGGWDEITPSAFLFNQFTKEGQTATTGLYDSRLYATLFFQCDYFNDPVAGRVYGGTYHDRFNEDGVPYNRPVFRKMMPPTLEALNLSRFANNIPLMRYANVLLMKAEALNELGRTAEAIPLINQVRDVHGDMPPMTGSSKEAVAAQIEHERIIEFPLENFRWYDLRRWGKLAGAMQAAGRTGFSVEKNAWYPVPLTEINSNEMID
jgi:tetratricopeptide (TPR) repeat protein